MPSRHERLLFALIAFSLFALAVAPVWASRFLPLLDEPNHLSAIAIWRGLVDHEPSAEAFYAPRIAPFSYMAHYGLALLLSFAVGVEAAHKVLVSVSVLALPLAALLWCRQTQRSRWLAVLTVPLAFSISWAHGFHPFNLGIGALSFALVAFDRFLLAATSGRFVAALLASLACYFAHPFPLGLLYVGTLVLLSIHRPRIASALLVLAALLPSAMLVAWQSRATSVAAGAADRVLGRDFPIVDAEAWKARLLDLPDHAVNPLAGPEDSRLLIALFAVTALLFVVGALRGPKINGSSLVAHRALALAVVYLAMYLVLPEHFGAPVYMWIARGRIAPVVAFFFLLAPPITEVSPLRFVAAASALAIAVLPLQMVARYRAFGGEMASMERVLEACPAEANVLTIRVGDQMHEGYDVPVFRQLPSWVQVMRGGYSPQWFIRPVPFPFEVKRKLPAPHWRAHERYGPSLDPTVYGCVLTHRLESELQGGAWQLAAAEGEFRLYVAR